LHTPNVLALLFYQHVRFPFACIYLRYMLRKLGGKCSLSHEDLSLEDEALKEIFKEILFFSFLCLY